MFLKLLKIAFPKPLQRKPRTGRRRVVAGPPRSRPNDPVLKSVWDRLVSDYFPDRADLLGYEVTWARRRQSRVLGSCNIRYLKIRIAKEMAHPEANQWIEAVLYHELCHAVIGMEVSRHRGKRAWHGTQFKELESRHPEIQGLKAWMKDGGWRRVSLSRLSAG